MEKIVRNQLRSHEREKCLNRCKNKTHSLTDYRTTVLLEESEQLLDRVYLKFATEWVDKVPVILHELFGKRAEGVMGSFVNFDHLFLQEDEEADVDAEFIDLLTESILFDYALLDGGTIYQRYLEREKRKLRPMVNEVVSKWADSYISVYEIEEIGSEGERGFFRDIFTGELFETDLKVLNYFLALTEGDLLVCRLLPINGYHNISGYFLLFGGLKNELIQLVPGLKAMRSTDNPTCSWSDFLKQYGYEVAMLAFDLSNAGLSNFYDSFNHLEETLHWAKDGHAEVARLIRSNLTVLDFSTEDILIAITLWHAYCEKRNPKITKTETHVAAMEYLISQGKGITQKEIADKYSVSTASISARSRDLLETFAEMKSLHEQTLFD